MTTLEKILKLKNQNSVSDAQLEREIGLKPKTIYDWKRGKSSTYYDNITSVANYFNVSTDYLLGNEQKEKSLSEKDKLIAEINIELNSMDDDTLMSFKNMLIAFARSKGK